jgi:hypothetical protein
MNGVPDLQEQMSEEPVSDDEELSNESGSGEKIKRRVICTPYI